MLRILQAVSLIIAVALPSNAAAQDPPIRKKTVQRAKRPIFSERDWEGIYFENLFAEGLVGARPENFGQPPNTVGRPPAEVVSADPEQTASGWSGWISSAALEDEIKISHLELEKLVTTAQSFKTQNAKVREALSRLSTWFAIVAEFNDAVRWKSDAAAVRDSLAQAAANARTSSDEAFASAKAIRDQLGEMIRGGKFAATSSGSSEMEWTHWVDRVALMGRLEASFTERLKPWTSNPDEFSAHAEEILHEANIIAAIGQSLIQSGLEDADDQEYSGFGTEMTQAAKELQVALEANQAEAAGSAVNRLGQACSNCHEAFR